MDHLLESDLEKICGNCGEGHNTDWKSEWDEHSPFMHYKVWTCSCGYKIHIKTEYETSGLE